MKISKRSPVKLINLLLLAVGITISFIIQIILLIVLGVNISNKINEYFQLKKIKQLIFLIEKDLELIKNNKVEYYYYNRKDYAGNCKVLNYQKGDFKDTSICEEFTEKWTNFNDEAEKAWQALFQSFGKNDIFRIKAVFNENGQLIKAELLGKVDYIYDPQYIDLPQNTTDTKYKEINSDWFVGLSRRVWSLD